MSADTQTRLQNAEIAIAALTREVQRLSSYSHGQKTSIPLAPMDSTPSYRNTAMRGRGGLRPAFVTRENEFRRPEQELPPVSLSELLQPNEVLTFQINTGKDGDGNLLSKTVLATFDGMNLTVTESEAIPALIGLTTSKPGEILFKFMFALKEANLISRTFNALPWRLCSVVRDGNRQTLSQLRKAKFDPTQ